MEAHGDDGSFGKRHGLAVVIDGLPVEVPLGNADEPFTRAVGQRRPGFEDLAEVVGVRIDGDDAGIERKAEIVGDPKSRAPAGMRRAPSCSSWTSRGNSVGGLLVK
jgi:hypothetical protein